MPFLNFDYNLLVYEDLDPKNPNARIADMTQKYDQVPAERDHSDRLVVYPGEIKDIAVTSRVLSWDSSTELSISRPLAADENIIRMSHTGVGSAPIFRTNRNILGDATTSVAITRVTGYVARIQNISGLAWDLSSVQVGDEIRFEKTTDAITSPFAANNQGRHFTVQAKGADYIDFVDNNAISTETSVTLGSNFSYVLKVVSATPVKARKSGPGGVLVHQGDFFEISGAGINLSNHGKFEILDVSDDFIEYGHPQATDETFLLGTNSLAIYEYLVGFVHIRSTGAFRVRFDTQTEWTTVGKIANTAVFMGSVCAHKIQVLNHMEDSVEISIQTLQVNNND